MTSKDMLTYKLSRKPQKKINSQWLTSGFQTNTLYARITSLMRVAPALLQDNDFIMCKLFYNKV